MQCNAMRCGAHEFVMHSAWFPFSTHVDKFCTLISDSRILVVFRLQLRVSFLARGAT